MSVAGGPPARPALDHDDNGSGCRSTQTLQSCYRVALLADGVRLDYK